MIARWQGAAPTRWPRLAVGARDRCRSTPASNNRGLAASAQAVQSRDTDAEQEEQEYPRRWQPSVAKRQRTRAESDIDRAEAYRNLFPRPADLSSLAPAPPATTLPDKSEARTRTTALHAALSQLYLVKDLATQQERHEALEVASRQSHLFSRKESQLLLDLIACYGHSPATVRQSMDDELFFDCAPPALLLPPLDMRSVRPSHVRAAELAFQEALPALEGLPPETRIKNIRIYLNRMLYLAARIPSRNIFERVRELFKRYEIQPDDYTMTARILLLDRTDQLGLLPGLWKTICSHGKPALIFFNAMLWAYGKRGHWDVVSQLYNRILNNDRREYPSLAFPEVPFFSAKLPPVPTDFRPGKDTYQCLILALAFHGNLHSALHVLQDLTRDPQGFQPDVADFLALFQGFAKYGEASSDFPTSQNEAAGLPLPEVYPRIPVSSKIKRQTAPFHASLRLSEIWSQSLTRHESPEYDRWTIATLDQILELLLAMQPPGEAAQSANPRQAARAPTPRATFNILMAYSRCTNGNVVRLQEVLTRLQAKFGDGNPEGWHGWRPDARLRRLAWTWQQQEQGDG